MLIDIGRVEWRFSGGVLGPAETVSLDDHELAADFSLERECSEQSSLPPSEASQAATAVGRCIRK